MNEEYNPGMGGLGLESVEPKKYRLPDLINLSPEDIDKVSDEIWLDLARRFWGLHLDEENDGYNEYIDQKHIVNGELTREGRIELLRLFKAQAEKLKEERAIKLNSVVSKTNNRSGRNNKETDEGAEGEVRAVLEKLGFVKQSWKLRTDPEDNGKYLLYIYNKNKVGGNGRIKPPYTFRGDIKQILKKVEAKAYELAELAERIRLVS